MKKIFVLFTFLISLISPACADVMPYYVGSINTNSIGVYQASNSIKVYKEPNENSPLVLDIFWNSKIFNSPDVSASNLFAVFLPAKELAFLQVIDEDENWVQIVYNQNGEKRGWVKKDDELKFSNWRTFYNNYGHKYGVYFMKDAPEMAKTIYSDSVDGSQRLGVVNMPQMVKLTAVKGNWLCVSVFDMDRLQKIGFVKWRNSNGEIYLFPSIK